MTKEEYMQNPNICLNCNKIIEIDYLHSLTNTTIKKFCNQSCSATYNNKKRKHSEITKNKIRIALTKKPHPTKPKQKTKKILKIKIKKVPKSLFDLSKRTITKILIRLNLGCSRCGWKESSCDIHHIHGKKIKNPDDHNNLSLLCPNCHRLIHTNKISSDELINLNEYIGNKWLDYYFPEKAGL